MIQPKYKQVKLFKPHCPKCGEMLTGNNSSYSPWECKCGTWVHSGVGEYGKRGYEILRVPARK